MAPPQCDIPIIALTADALRGAGERYRQAGMDGYLSKPLSSKSLFRTLNDIARDGRPVLEEDSVSALQGILAPAQVAESLADISARVERLSACLDAADPDGAAREAHDIVTVAGNCGLRTLGALAGDIERACRTGALDEAIGAFGHVEAVAAKAREALATVRSGLAAESN
jgi:HPt (histidine-containing phosphotransfer) domain-containing protein